MTHSFNFYSNKGFIIFLMILTLLPTVLLGLSLIQQPTEFALYIPFLGFSGILFLLIHRAFIVKITFHDDKIVYKSLIKEKVYHIDDIDDIILVKNNRKSSPDCSMYENDFVPTTIGNPYYIMIGSVYYYPQNPYLILFKPVGDNYIMLQYRKTLQEPLRRFVDRRNEKYEKKA